jgi:C4-dicarboxylate-specific signal transduction histidine kinase
MQFLGVSIVHIGRLSWVGCSNNPISCLRSSLEAFPPDTPNVKRTATPTQASPEQLVRVEALLEHFEQLEEQFRQVRDGLTHSHRLATLGMIASIIAHEYNNILTPMMSYAQLALAKPDDAALMKKAVEKSLAGSERAAKISASLLGFAREADEKHAARLPSVVEESVACLARDPKKDGIEFSADVPDVQVAISPLNLQQIFVNLFMNARQAMRKSGGRLEVTGRIEGTLVRIGVRDTGPGISEAIMHRLFEPFATHRPNVEPGERKGTGLGLCICRDLVRQAGGTIEVQSRPGQGALFRITLPKADDLFNDT